MIFQIVDRAKIAGNTLRGFASHSTNQAPLITLRCPGGGPGDHTRAPGRSTRQPAPAHPHADEKMSALLQKMSAKQDEIATLRKQKQQPDTAAPKSCREPHVCITGTPRHRILGDVWKEWVSPSVSAGASSARVG